MPTCAYCRVPGAPGKCIHCGAVDKLQGEGIGQFVSSRYIMPESLRKLPIPNPAFEVQVQEMQMETSMKMVALAAMMLVQGRR